MNYVCNHLIIKKMRPHSFKKTNKRHFHLQSLLGWKIRSGGTKKTEKYDIIDSNTIKYRSGFVGGGAWYLCMYGWFNKGDKLEIKFEFQSKGWPSSHVFGFATHEWW
eukprot:128150_1